jgi:hypothetical protein
MAVGAWFYIGSGIWAAAMLAAFIQAIRLSYRIEQRSAALRNGTGLPRYAAVPFTVTNWRVSRDDETQRLRRRMNVLLAANLAGFVLFGLIVLLVLPR